MRQELSDEHVRELADLAMLELPDDRLREVARAYRGLMALAQRLWELDTTDLEPDLPFNARWERDGDE